MGNSVLTAHLMEKEALGETLIYNNNLQGTGLIVPLQSIA